MPDRVYWVRRLVLLAAVVAVVLAVRSCVGGDDPVSTDAAVPVGAATPAPPRSGQNAAAPSPTTRPTASTAPSASPTDLSPTDLSPTDPPPSVQPCPAGALALVATEPGEQVPAGSPFQIVGTLSTTSASPCTVDIGPAAVLAVLTSGDDRIWSSQDCASSAGQTVVVAADAPVAVPVDFAGRRSRPGCPGDGDPTRVGTYRLSLSVDGVTAPQRVLRMR